MPGIRKRKNGLYEIRKMENGTSKSIYTRSLQEALKIKNKFIKNKIKIEDNKKESNNYTLKEWILLWEEKYKKPFITKKSFNDLHGSLKQVINKLGDMKLKDLKTSQIQELLNSLKKNRTKERTELYFNALLEKACNLDYIKKNPFKAVEKIKKGKYRDSAYTFDEQKLILSITKGTEIECEVLIYLVTGARPAEFPKINDIDFKNKVIHLYGTKNENSEHREVDLSDSFINYLQEHLKNHTLKSYPYIQRKFKKLLTGHVDKIRLYKLRHSFASNHHTLKTQIKQVSQWMGHSSIKITLDTYTDIDKTATKKKIQNLYNNYYYIKN